MAGAIAEDRERCQFPFIGPQCFAQSDFVSTGTAPPLQLLSVNQPNVQIGTYPTVMIPALGVPSSIILHVFVAMAATEICAEG
jgi:hypothetical protein